MRQENNITPKTIIVSVLVKAPMAKVWEYWNKPEHIVHWAFASSDWEAPPAENDLRVGEKFKTTMAAKDKSSSFDFTGQFTITGFGTVLHRARIIVM